jgi:hypothetical protein
MASESDSPRYPVCPLYCVCVCVVSPPRAQYLKSEWYSRGAIKEMSAKTHREDTTGVVLICKSE